MQTINANKIGGKKGVESGVGKEEEKEVGGVGEYEHDQQQLPENFEARGNYASDDFL